MILLIYLISNQKIFQASFNRENIHYNIKYTEETKEKMTEILNFIIEHVNDSGIIYCHKREDCDVVSEYLKSSGISASSYHAGMNNEQRKNALDGWISGIYSTIVATIAFGMGVDKQDVRYVIHYTIPKTLEDFYQETGRAGRDGKLSESIVYYSASDYSLFKFLLSKQDTNKKKEDEDISVEKRLKDLDLVARLCLHHGCRRQKLLTYFGENNVECNKGCDWCKDKGSSVKKSLEIYKKKSTNNNFKKTSTLPSFTTASKLLSTKILIEEKKERKEISI